MSFFENTRKPVGLGGKIMVAMLAEQQRFALLFQGKQNLF